MDATDQVILVADDEANILMLLEMELQAEGFKTIGCSDGAKALAQIRESCLLYTSPSPRDGLLSRMPSSA